MAIETADNIKVAEFKQMVAEKMEDDIKNVQLEANTLPMFDSKTLTDYKLTDGSVIKELKSIKRKEHEKEIEDKANSDTKKNKKGGLMSGI